MIFRVSGEIMVCGRPHWGAFEELRNEKKVFIFIYILISSHLYAANEDEYKNRSNNNGIITINARKNPIVNPFNFEEQYTNGGKY